MERWVRTDRANERRVARSLRGGKQAVRSRYARLMQVEIKHGYYAGAGLGGLCPDFAALPLPPTADLMGALGLLLLREPAGFSVLYDVTRAEGLFWYLRQHGTPPLGGGAANGHWTRLSFALSLTNLRFVNFTDIPVGTDPNSENFYFTNQDAHRLDGGHPVLLTRGDRVDAAALLPVVGPELRVETPPEVIAVIARDIAGKIVLDVPRCVEPPAGPPVCRNFVFLDFGRLDEGRYTIETVEKSGRPRSRREVLYTIAAPIPLCFIDLMLTRPTANATGIYPVQNLYPESQTSIREVRYELGFEARETYWRYYIQPPPHQRLEDLAIETAGTMPPVGFAGPDEVELVSGGLAYRFVSQQSLRLHRRSPYRFRLMGRAMRTVTGDDVLARRLAVAGPDQVLPEPEGALLKTYSDIFVSI